MLNIFLDLLLFLSHNNLPFFYLYLYIFFLNLFFILFSFFTYFYFFLYFFEYTCVWFLQIILTFNQVVLIKRRPNGRINCSPEQFMQGFDFYKSNPQVIIIKFLFYKIFLFTKSCLLLLIFANSFFFTTLFLFCIFFLLLYLFTFYYIISFFLTNMLVYFFGFLAFFERVEKCEKNH